MGTPGRYQVHHNKPVASQRRTKQTPETAPLEFREYEDHQYDPHERQEHSKAPTGPLPDVMATVKIAVNPSRAAVFLDGLFVGHVGEFEGLGRGMLIAPGTHQIKIALPGYQTFETAINPLANQQVEIKTDLVKNGAPLAESLVKTETGAATPPPIWRSGGSRSSTALKCDRTQMKSPAKQGPSGPLVGGLS